MKKVAIAGCTGMLGKPVTQVFIDNGFEVTVLVRDIEKARKIFGDKVSYVAGDLNDKAAIEKLLAGNEGLYINLSVKPESSEKEFQPEREGLVNLIELARKTSLKRIGYLSSLVHHYQGMNHFNWWVFDIKKQAVDHIRNSGIPYSVFYPSTFMECFGPGPYRSGNKIMLAGKSEVPMYFIAARDYARQVVRSFVQDEGNCEYAIQGPEALTADKAAKIFAENYPGTKLKILSMPIGMLRFFGNFSKRMNYGAHIIEALNRYPEKFEAGETWDKLGKPVTTIADYAREC